MELNKIEKENSILNSKLKKINSDFKENEEELTYFRTHNHELAEEFQKMKQQLEKTE